MGFFDNNGLVDLVKNYLKTQFELVKLDIQERLEALLERIFKFIIVTFALAIGVLFFLHALANMLNTYLGSQYWGHFIVSGICLIVGGLMVASFRQPTESQIETEEEIAVEEENREDESDN
jgi:hypothetical protein